MKDVVYPFRPAVRITRSLFVACIRVYEAAADKFLDNRTVEPHVHIAANDPGIRGPIWFEVIINQLSDLPVSKALLRQLILLPPSQVCGGDSDNTPLKLEAAY